MLAACCTRIRLRDRLRRGPPSDRLLDRSLGHVRLGDGVPLAAYGPRGSEQAVANIRAAVVPGVPAVLLANHGVLVFHRTPELAILVGGSSRRRPKRDQRRQPRGTGRGPRGLRATALQRAMAFESKGTVHTWSVGSFSDRNFSRWQAVRQRRRWGVDGWFDRW